MALNDGSQISAHEIAKFVPMLHECLLHASVRLVDCLEAIISAARRFLDTTHVLADCVHLLLEKMHLILHLDHFIIHGVTHGGIGVAHWP